VGTYLIAALVLPDVAGDEPLDLRSYYFANRRWFFTLGLLTIVVSMAKDRILSGAWPAPPLNLILELVLVAILATGTFVSSERVHKTLAPFAAVWLVLYIALLFGHLH